MNTIRTTGRWPIGLTPGLFWSAVAIVLAAVTAQAEGAVDATADYDPGNIFARIVRGEAPADIVFENEYAIAFHDIAPRREIHVLVIPKGPYTNILHFNAEASDGEKLALLDAISETARIMGVADSGFRLVSNTGEGGHQTVPHLHFHLLGGKPPDEVD